MAAAAVAARRGRRRVVVLALLLALVLAPMLLYGGAPIPPFSDSILARIAFDREASNLVARNEAGERLNALPQDSFDVVKEPVWMVASNLSLAKDLGGPGEHKNRVLEATNDEHVGMADSEHHKLEHSDVSGETEEGELQDAGEAEDNTEAVVVDNSNAQSGQNGKFRQDGHHEGAMDAAGEMRESTDDEVQNGEEMEAEFPDTSEEERSDEHTESGQDGVIEQVVDRESGTNRAGGTGESKDTRMQNGEEMEIESQDASAMEHKNEVVTATKSASHARKGSGVSNDGTGKARENNNDGTHGALDLNASMKKENTADASSKPITHAASRGSETRSRISNADHSTTVPDSTVRIIRDQLKRARTYIGFLASRGNHGFVKDLRAQMRDIQQEVGDATSDQQLPKNIHVKIRAIEQTLANIKQVHDRCSAVINKLRASHRSTEEQLLENKKEANYLVQIAAKAVPKGLHCLALRLTNEYYSTSYNEKRFPHEEKFEDPKLYHYALFSDNVLAAAVVVNSTLVNAKKPANHVFHIVTDRLNYAAMKMWFLDNPFGKAAIQVQNIEEFTWLNSSYSPVLKQLESQSMINYYFRAHQAKPDENLKFRNPKYLSILNHLRFYLPEMFPKLNKVLFLDDDTVVQQDLSTLWSINLNGKVNGAVETCGESFHRFDKYLNFSNPLIAKKFDPHACGWAYGMNMFDLVEWRKQNITDVYHSWQKLNENRLLWKLGTLPAGLVTFWNRTFPLDRTWHQLGLGYNPNIYPRDIERAAVIHYNGNLKPWLEIGLPKYRKYWSKYVNFDQVFLRECNINP